MKQSEYETLTDRLAGWRQKVVFLTAHRRGTLEEVLEEFDRVLAAVQAQEEPRSGDPAGGVR